MWLVFDVHVLCICIIMPLHISVEVNINKCATYNKII